MKISESISNYYIYILLFLTMILWGGTWPVGRWLVTDTAGPTIPPLMVALIRYIIVSVIFLVILIYKDKGIQFQFFKDNYIELILMGFFLIPVYQIGYVFGNVFTSASDASIIISTSPLWVLILGFLLFKYEINLKLIIGPLLGILGVSLIINFSPNTNVENRVIGDMLIIIASIAYAVYTILLNRVLRKKHSDPPSPLAVLTWVFLVGTILILPISLLFSPEYFSINSYFVIPSRIWTGILYLALLATVWGFLLYAEAVNRFGATRTVMFLNLIPVFGILLSSVWLGEKIDLFIHSLSLIIILIGVFLVNRNSRI